MSGQLVNHYTSTGNKLAHHRSSLQEYFLGEGHSVISTSISPEGRCNLKCSYCSVHKRKPTRLDFNVIKTYVDHLVPYGLKAVVLTGGGEPLLYSQIEDLLEALFLRGLQVGLITNGTRFDRVSDELLGGLTWIRVSVNPGVDVHIPPFGPTFGLSTLFTTSAELERAIKLRRESGAEYLRVVPNCLVQGPRFDIEWATALALIQALGGEKTFLQGRKHQTPNSSYCHLGHFRPYLSEVAHPDTGEPGAVFPCDSIPLHNSQGYFNTHWSIGPPGKIVSYLEERLEVGFKTSECNGCMFSQHVDLIDHYTHTGELPEKEDCKHVNFI